MTNITIIGGHGKIALLTAPLLVSDKHQVQSVFRNPEHEDAVASTGATPVVGDIETMSVADMAELLSGQDVLIWSAGAGGGNPERTYAVDRDAAIRSMQAAEQAGVKRYIMVSYSRSGHDPLVKHEHSFYPYATAKAEADDFLRSTSLNWTILGPGRLTLDEASGKILTFGDKIPEAATETSRENVARVIVESLRLPQSERQTINFFDGDMPIPEAIATFAP